MFRWYRNASCCYVYLSDVGNKADLARSRWFTTGWALQELIAPAFVIFFDRYWQDFGTKASSSDEISVAAGNPCNALKGYYEDGNCCVAQKMSWAAQRKTTRSEDIAYCLLGLFDVHMPMIYGEGGKDASIRLQREILKTSDDQSLFAWSAKYISSYPKERTSGLLTEYPSYFADCGGVKACRTIPHLDECSSEYSQTNKGISIELPIIEASALHHMGNSDTRNTFVAFLKCESVAGESIGIYLEPYSRSTDNVTTKYLDTFTRVNTKKIRRKPYADLLPYKDKIQTRRIYVTKPAVDKGENTKAPCFGVSCNLLRHSGYVVAENYDGTTRSYHEEANSCNFLVDKSIFIGLLVRRKERREDSAVLKGHHDAVVRADIEFNLGQHETLKDVVDCYSSETAPTGVSVAKHRRRREAIRKGSDWVKKSSNAGTVVKVVMRRSLLPRPRILGDFEMYAVRIIVQGLGPKENGGK